jgi:hypothetical protein
MVVDNMMAHTELGGLDGIMVADMEIQLEYRSSSAGGEVLSN